MLSAAATAADDDDDDDDDGTVLGQQRQVVWSMINRFNPTVRQHSATRGRNDKIIYCGVHELLSASVLDFNQRLIEQSDG